MKKQILLAIAAFSTASSFACPDSFFFPEEEAYTLKQDWAYYAPQQQYTAPTTNRAQIFVSALLALSGLELMEQHYNERSAAFAAGLIMALGGSTYLLAQL